MRLGGRDADAFHKRTSGEIESLADKATPVAADLAVVEDSEDGFKKKKILLTDLLVGGAPSGPAGGDLNGTYPDPGVDDGADGSAVHVGDAAGGDLGGTYPDPTVDDGADGSAVHVGDAAGGDLGGTYPDPTVNDGADATAIHSGDAAGGDLGGTYPDPTVDDGADGSAIHDDVAGEINAVPVKATPVDADVVLIEDSADAFAKKKITLADLLAGGGGGGGGAGVKTGTYVGDGELSNPITGVGFTPVYVSIWQRKTGVSQEAPHWETTDQIIDDNAAGGAMFSDANSQEFQPDKIITLDADGFTVDDNGANAHPNQSGITYNFLCIGASSGITPSARVRRATPQTIPNGVLTALSFSDERWDDGGFWVIGAPTRLTAPKAGLYIITASILWEPSLVGIREMNIRLNGTTPLAKVVDNIPDVIDIEQQFLSTVYKLIAGDYIEIMVFQNGGVGTDVNVVANSSPEATIAELR